MSGLHNLKPDRVVKAFERAGWTNEGQRGSHKEDFERYKPETFSDLVKSFRKYKDD